MAEDAGALVDLDRLDACLATLAERERMVVLLTFYSERPSPEIARTLNVSDGNVRVIRSRAIARLRACMDAKGTVS
jgi:RNA polymerase sigma factor (sigma-70 family)